MKKKADLRKLLGNTITGVIIKQGSYVKCQVFLIFKGGEHCELYTDDEIRCSGIREGGTMSVREYMAPAQEIVFDRESSSKPSQR